MSAVPLPYTDPYVDESLLGLVASQSVAKAMANLNSMDEEDDAEGAAQDYILVRGTADINVSIDVNNEGRGGKYVDMNALEIDEDSMVGTNSFTR